MNSLCFAAVLLLSVVAFAGAFSPASVRSGLVLSKCGSVQQKKFLTSTTSLWKLNASDDDDEYAFANKKKITRKDEGEYFESEVRR
jgi:hypothetical protein